MRSKILAAIAAALITLASGAQAQFLNTTQYDNGINFSTFVHADVNNDGKTDIVGISNSTPAAITVLLGTGTGGFGAPISTTISGLETGSFQRIYVLGDFNGDGRLDIALFGLDSITGQNAVAVMLGNGNGTFQPGIETVLGGVIGQPQFGTCTANSADYNDDGKTDIAFLVNNHGAISVVTLPGKDDGTFSSAIIASAPSGGACLATGDFNNDKKQDLAVAAQAGTIFMMLGNGNGTFQAPVAVGKGGSYIVAAKLTSGPNLDLVAAEVSNPGAITILLGDGTSHFPTKQTINEPVGVFVNSSLVVRDLNGDHLADIAFIGTAAFDSVIGVLLNNGDGSFTPGKLYIGDGALDGGAVSIFAGDLNSDGKIDLAFTNLVGGITVMLGNGNGTFQGNLATLGAGGANAVVVEFDGSTTPDLLFTFPEALDTFLGNGDGTFTVVKTGCGLGPVTVGDFTNNGKFDLAGIGSLSGVPMIGVCLGNGNGTFTPTSGAFDQGIQHRFVLSGDFNNDGKLDLAASDQNGVSILLGNGDGTFQSGIPTAVSQTYPTFVLADFNGDGKLDFASIIGSTVSVFLGKGNGTFEAPLASSCSCNNSPEAMTVLDLNGDGKLDLLVMSGGNAIVLLGKGNGTFQTPVRYTLSEGAASPAAIADFNGDGKLDIAVAVGNFNGSSKNNEGSIALLFGDGTGKFSAPTLFNAGGPMSEGPVGLATADFNGDGKPDLVLNLDVIVTFLNQE